MNRKRTKLLVTLVFAIGFSIVNAGKIVVIGDSTAASYSPKRYPLSGWGQVMVEELKGKNKVINMARSGRSSKSYINEGYWDKVKKILQHGDILLIQFGHNDEKKNKPTIGSTVEEFKTNLSLYVNEAREKGAKPVLISPVCRRRFKNNIVIDTHGKYSKSVAETAKKMKVYFVDLSTLSTAWLNKLGAKASTEYYMHLAPGKYPGYPKGRKDNTHFNKKGANAVYKIISDELKKQNIL